MTERPAEAVFFWRFSTTTFKAVYGRAPSNKTPSSKTSNGKTYTKDFFQSPASQWPVIDKVLGHPPVGGIRLEYRWPGGVTPGTWRQSAADPRGQLAWDTTERAPLPWRIGNPQTDPMISLEGDPTKTTEAEADDVLKDIEKRNYGAWFLAVKLRDEPNVLYPRVYFENPPEQLSKRSVGALPALVRDALRALPRGTGGGAIVFENVPVSKLVQRILDALQTDNNVLLVGPPGTGKTVALEGLAAHFAQGGTPPLFDPQSLDGTWSYAPTKTLSIVFHPSYEYEEFVTGLVPVPELQGFRLEARPGPFLSMAHWCIEGRRGLLLIDEFNRGNAAAIFGDMLPLLDHSKRRTKDRPGIFVSRPYSRYEMQVDQEFAQPDGNVELPPSISLSDQLFIVAALNSTDRSVAPLDAALRRRFAIIAVGPDYEALAAKWNIGVPQPEAHFAAAKRDFDSWTREDVFELGLRILLALNERIRFVMGDDFLLGQALLWPIEGADAAELLVSLARAVDERITATLRMTFVDQDESLAMILNAGAPPSPGEQPKLPTAAVARWRLPPQQIYSGATPRLVISQLTTLAPPDALRALQSLL